MLSPGHMRLEFQTIYAGANPLASGHFVFEDQNNNVTGNNLDSGQTQAVAHFGRARVNPFAVGHTGIEAHSQNAHGNTLTPGHACTATQSIHTGATFQRAIDRATTNKMPPAVLTPANARSSTNVGPPGTFTNATREQ